MPSAISAIKDLESDPSVFADFINFSCFDGQTKLHPDSLQNLPETEVLSVSFEQKNSLTRQEISNNYRDIVGNSVFMRNDTTLWLLINLAPFDEWGAYLPVQISRFLSILNSHGQPLSALIVNWKAQSWSDFISKYAGVSLLPSWSVPLLEPTAMSDETIMGFKSSWMPALMAAKYQESALGLKTAIDKTPERYEKVSPSVAKVISFLTGMDCISKDPEIDVRKKLTEAISETRKKARQETLEEHIHALLGILPPEKIAQALKTTPKVVLDVFGKP